MEPGNRIESRPQLENNEEAKDEQTFNRYVVDLDLTEEDLQKKILDVGSGRGRFARHAQHRNINSEVYSVDPRPIVQGTIKATRARAEHLPFNDEEFQLVLSNASFPFFTIKDWEINEQIKAGNTEPLQERLRGTLRELLRVIRVGGELRLGRVSKEDVIPIQRTLELVFDRVLDEFTADGIIDSVEEIPEVELHRRAHAKGLETITNPDSLDRKPYLLKLKKLK